MRTAASPARAVEMTGLSLTLDRLGKRFDGTPVLHDLSLTMPGGQFLAVVGRSGSGKSTLLRIVSGLDRPSSGRLLLDGQAPQPDAARIMFQEPRLLPWARVIDNVMVGLQRDSAEADGRARAHAALEAVGLGDRANHWPTVLSGGQKQRVALARALVSRPRLLLLDEPLGALDALTRLEMQALIAHRWRDQGFTAILVTHDVAEAVRLADRIVVIENGTLTLDVANPASHPRTEGSAASSELERMILHRLMQSS